MGVKYICNVTGDEYNQKDLFKNIIPCAITVRAGNQNQRLGVIHISKEVLPEEFLLKISSDVGWKIQKPEITIGVSGNILPTESTIKGSMMGVAQGGRQKPNYKYLCEEPEVSDISLIVNSMSPQGKVIHSYTYQKDEEEVQNFINKIEEDVITICEAKHDQNETIDGGKDNEDDGPRGTTFN